MWAHSRHFCLCKSKSASDRSLRRLGQGFSLFRAAVRSILPVALLGMGLSVQAQSPFPVLSPQINSATIAPRDNYVRRTPEVGSRVEGWDKSTATVVESVGATTTPPAESSLLASSVFVPSICVTPTPYVNWLSGPQGLPQSVGPQSGLIAGGRSDENSKPPLVEVVHPPKPPDFNRSIYYKNKLEFGLDVGYLPINIPFVFDVFLGDGYTMTSLKYTLVPVFASLRWQIDDVGGWSFLRGNWDMTFTGSITAIPRGPETRYFSYIMGIRRNFVPRNWKVAPYFDGRLGLGDIDAKGPLGVLYAQGQNFTFTVNMGSGVRYNFNPRYSISAGLNWMHISNLYLSQPQFANYGINVYGPMFGIDVRIGKPHHASE